MFWTRESHIHWEHSFIIYPLKVMLVCLPMVKAVLAEVKVWAYLAVVSRTPNGIFIAPITPVGKICFFKILSIPPSQYNLASLSSCNIFQHDLFPYFLNFHSLFVTFFYPSLVSYNSHRCLGCTPGCTPGTISISAMAPCQFLCSGKSTVMSFRFLLITLTTPTLAWETAPQLCLCVCISIHKCLVM